MIKQKNNSSLQKITIYVPKQLLTDAQKIADENITETVKNGLQLLIAAKASENLRKMRGKIKFSIDIQELREDK